MKNMRIPLLIAWGVAVLGIILGSFFDYAISSAIASSTNGFALTISAILPTIGFAGVALMGGGFVAFALKGKYPLGLKILFYVLAACCLGVSIYYPQGEYFGINGFYQAAPGWVGYLIVLVPECAAMYLGYRIFKNNENKYMWVVFCIIIGLLLLALLVIIPNIKDNMHRPRYRYIAVSDVAFHNWWEPYTEYKDYIAAHPNVAHDHFKSFPSGHTAEVSILFVGATFYPLANKGFEKYQLLAFIASGALVLLVALARILAAAHFLSDVSWGATIMLTLTFIANEVVMRIKALHIPEAE